MDGSEEALLGEQTHSTLGVGLHQRAPTYCMLLVGTLH